MRHTNRDCVIEFDTKRIRSECLTPGHVTSVMTYEVTGPGRYRAAMEGKEPLEWREIEYVIDEQWLTITSVPQQRAGMTVPEKIVSLNVRVDLASGQDTCHPRGPSKVHASRGVSSSLALTPPPGYLPSMKDPFEDPALARGINSNFLIGQFSAAESGSSHYVLLVEDSRTGARPVKPADFRRLKASLKQEVGEQFVSCEDERRICFDTRPSTEAPRYMTTTFVNVKGRVAIVYAVLVGGLADNESLAKRSANLFAKQILRDNR